MTDRVNITEYIEISVMVRAGNWEGFLPDYEAYIEAALEQIIEGTAEGAGFKNFSFLELSIVLADDELLRELNRGYREKDKATNVLSFPSLKENEIEKYFQKNAQVPEMPFSLGDVIISLETIQKEAIVSDKALKDHFIHLMIHGLLHLLGYDHIQNDEAEYMEALETKLLANLKINDPYKDITISEI
jgi:probable rRNA maturation factor